MRIETTPEDLLRSLDTARRERRERKRAQRVGRAGTLGPWELYRALTDRYDCLQELSEQTDRKARFALLILGSLNALNVLLAVRGDLIGLPRSASTFALPYVTAYVTLSLVLFLYAIAVLRPRRAPSGDECGAGVAAPLGAHVMSIDDYREHWRALEIAQLNDALVTLTYGAQETMATRTRALQRVYAGLGVLVVLTAGLLLALLGSALRF